MFRVLSRSLSIRKFQTGQNEARILMALYEGLTEYDPKTGESIPLWRNVGKSTRTPLNSFSTCAALDDSRTAIHNCA